MAIGMMIAGAVVSAIGAIQSSNAQASAAEYNAQAAVYRGQVAANNATIANSNATYALEAGESEAQRQELSTRALIGNELAAQGSSGLDVNSGTPVNVRAGSAALGEWSALSIRNNAARSAYGYQVQGLNYTAQAALEKQQASLDTMQASSAKAAGIIGVVGALVGGGAKVASAFSGGMNSGSSPL